jgi:hypothetical protein
MSEGEGGGARRDPGLELLAAGLGLGLLGDLALRITPWGAGAALTAALVLGAVCLLQRRHGTPVAGRIAQGGVVGVAAAGLLWRDATVLKALDASVIVVALALLASERMGQRGPRTLAAYAARVLGSAFHSLFGAPVVLVADVSWRTLNTPWRTGVGALRGLLLALPVVIVFGSLLASADAVFSARLAALIDVDLLAVCDHLLGIAACAWLAAGLLRAAVRRADPAHRPFVSVDGPLLGVAEAAIVLGLVDLLFGGFVWVQLRYLFGGSEWVQQVAGLGYAEYARRGFFELVAVTALVLPLLLVLEWAVRPQGRARTLFASLAGLQVALVLVMLASAFERMRLYRAEYGLTELRVYTTAFMSWLGVLLLLFAGTVLRGRREDFARAALASAVAAVVGLHVFDPERRIVETNRAIARAFDAGYAAGLSADAVPALVDTVGRLDEADKRRVAHALLARWSASAPEDWRAWSLSRRRARLAVLSAEPALRVAAGDAQASAR